jgi:hypothetical protein
VQNIQEIYASVVLPLTPQQRLQLASLILEDLTASSPFATEWSDSWSDEDIEDMRRFTGQQFEAREDQG